MNRHENNIAALLKNRAARQASREERRRKRTAAARLAALAFFLAVLLTVLLVVLVTPDSLYAMKLLSDITTGAKITFNDNGVATSVVTKKGIDLQANETIRPIVKLRPYRTFQEVEQPESTFLIRVNERGISFTEADGGMWKLTARETVKRFLEERLAQEVAEGSVVVAL